MKRPAIVIALSLILLPISAREALALSRPHPSRVMVAVGDSMTAGTFANTTAAPLQAPLTSDMTQIVSRYQAQPALLGQGDDLKTSFFKFLLRPFLETKNRYSWATGLQIESHFLRLKESIARSLGMGGRSLGNLNLSIPGSQSLQILDQVRALPDRLLEIGNPRIDYLAMTLGSNDACISTAGPVVPDEEFTELVRAIFSALADAATKNGRSAEDPLKVLVAGIPPIPAAGEKRFWEHRVLPGLRCRTIRRKIFPFCPNLLNWRDENEFRERMDEVARKNTIIEQGIAEANASMPQVDLVFGSSLTQIRFEPEDLAFDCFHPNSRAQQRMADLLWQDQPWY